MPCAVHRCHRRHLRLIHTLHLVDALAGTQAGHALVQTYTAVIYCENTIGRYKFEH